VAKRFDIETKLSSLAKWQEEGRLNQATGSENGTTFVSLGSIRA
jgi:hypothetical protein